MAILKNIYRLKIVMAILLLVLSHSNPASAKEELELYEQEIKAGLLYNFLKYTNWPAAEKSTSTMSVCIFGEDPFSGYLRPMEGRSVNQRVIKIISIHASSEVDKCNM